MTDTLNRCFQFRQLGLLGFLLVLLGQACQPSRIDTQAEAEKLMELSRQWSNIANSGDLEANLAGWADDALMMVPGLPPLRGKESIREYVEGAFDIPGFHISWEPLEAHVSAGGDLAYLIERNQINVQDSLGNTITQHNKVVTVWRKDEAGTWKNVIDMWNEAPAPEK